MLADLQHPPPQFGSFAQDVHLPASSLYELLNFILDELPRWRDRPDRKKETSETVLSSQLCAHLNSAARCSRGWDILQFRTEEPDERSRGRRIDLVSAPCDAVIWVEGRRHIDFDTLLPIECKRLPTPRDGDRDEREYVFSRHASTGGIQRFKAGHHGAAHRLGAMIAYLQGESCLFWKAQIAAWIQELNSSGRRGWTVSDELRLEHNDTTRKIAILSSSHAREKDLPHITLRHLWVQMT